MLWLLLRSNDYVGSLSLRTVGALSEAISARPFEEDFFME